METSGAGKARAGEALQPSFHRAGRKIAELRAVHQKSTPRKKRRRASVRIRLLDEHRAPARPFSGPRRAQGVCRGRGAGVPPACQDGAHSPRGGSPPLTGSPTRSRVRRAGSRPGTGAPAPASCWLTGGAGTRAVSPRSSRLCCAPASASRRSTLRGMATRAAASVRFPISSRRSASWRRSPSPSPSSGTPWARRPRPSPWPRDPHCSRGGPHRDAVGSGALHGALRQVPEALASDDGPDEANPAEALRRRVVRPPSRTHPPPVPVLLAHDRADPRVPLPRLARDRARVASRRAPREAGSRPPQDHPRPRGDLRGGRISCAGTSDAPGRREERGLTVSSGRPRNGSSPSPAMASPARHVS